MSHAINYSAKELTALAISDKLSGLVNSDYILKESVLNKITSLTGIEKQLAILLEAWSALFYYPLNADNSKAIEKLSIEYYETEDTWKEQQSLNKFTPCFAEYYDNLGNLYNYKAALLNYSNLAANHAANQAANQNLSNNQNLANALGELSGIIQGQGNIGLGNYGGSLENYANTGVTPCMWGNKDTVGPNLSSSAGTYVYVPPEKMQAVMDVLNGTETVIKVSVTTIEIPKGRKFKG